MDLESYLRVPYLLEVSSTEMVHGDWVRRAEYVEIPSCVVEAESIVDAIAAVDELRVVILATMIRDGETPPLPRPPLENIDPKRDLARLASLGLAL